MKLIDDTYIPQEGGSVEFKVSPSAQAILADSRFKPSLLAQSHLERDKAMSIGAIDVKIEVLDKAKLTSFLLSGDLVVWALSLEQSSERFVFLPGEYVEIREHLI